MFGLPNQTEKEYLDTSVAVADNGVTHISAYALILEEGTPLFGQVKHKEITVPDDDAVADMMESGIRFLANRGYTRYEISNFAKPGYECRHNLNCWRLKPYLGLGLNAASLLPAAQEETQVAYVRRTNMARMDRYLAASAQANCRFWRRWPLRASKPCLKTVMLGLRTVQGVSFADFERMHGQKLDGLRRGDRDAGSSGFVEAARRKRSIPCADTVWSCAAKHCPDAVYAGMRGLIYTGLTGKAYETGIGCD